MPFCLIIPVFIFIVFLFWRICEKAGHSGALSLITLIPGIGMLILLCILAFGTWPNQSSGVGYVQPGYVPTAQPGYAPQPGYALQPGYAPMAQPGYAPAPQPGYGPAPQPPQSGYNPPMQQQQSFPSQPYASYPEQSYPPQQQYPPYQ